MSDTGTTATLNQQIDALNQTVLNLQALADSARAKGDFGGAQDLSTQAVALSDQLGPLRTQRRDEAFIVEQAGGACSTGRERVMEISPKELHQRVPVVLGSKNEVERVVAYHKEMEADAVA